MLGSATDPVIVQAGSFSKRGDDPLCHSIIYKAMGNDEVRVYRKLVVGTLFAFSLLSRPGNGDGDEYASLSLVINTRGLEFFERRKIGGRGAFVSDGIEKT